MESNTVMGLNLGRGEVVAKTPGRLLAPIFLLTVNSLSLVTAAELPVKEIVLYKHGVGYFQREGRLGPGESATLSFKASEMNDVLKSLTIEEKGGGEVTALRYDSSEPLEQKLAEYPISIGEKQPLAEVLDQWKGARIEVKFGTETVAGLVVGARLVAAEEKRPEREQITILLDSGDLRTFDLSAATGLRFPDVKLQTILKDYLAALVRSRSTEKRSVYIDSTDSRNRELKAGYLIPTPVWKSSYRLIFGSGPQPLIEGWAIVDNTTGEDWTNVNLSLVSGRPISFISNLYEPRYVARKTAQLAEDEAAAAVVHQGPMGVVGGVPGGVAAGRGAMNRRMDKAPVPDRQEAMMASAGMMVAESSIAPAAVSREIGELFEYRIGKPLTVRKSESAMLPFLQQRTAGRKLLIYFDTQSVHPTNAVEISNSTGKILDGGPVTVFDAGAYAGEALMETLKAGDKRLISYGVDLGTRVTTLFDSQAAFVRNLKYRRGILSVWNGSVETRTYTVRNVDQRPKTLIIEHPARPQYTLRDRKPSETTASAYRFEIKLAPGAEEKFPVSEERVYATQVSVTTLTPDAVLLYAQNKALSPQAKRDLEGIAEQKRKIADASAEFEQTNSESAALTRDQERARQNIASLSAVAGQQEQVQIYAKQLAAQEARIVALRERNVEAQQRKAALEAALRDMLEKIEF